MILQRIYSLLIGLVVTTSVVAGGYIVGVQTGVIPPSSLSSWSEARRSPNGEIGSHDEKSQGGILDKTTKVLGASVLAAQTQDDDFQFSLNVESIFNENATFKKNIVVGGNQNVEGDLVVKGNAVFSNGISTNGENIDLGSGNLTASTVTASNVLYGVTAGSGITVGDGQKPTVSNTGVLSLGGSTGALTLAAGTGVSVSGLTISNTGATSVQGKTGDVTFTAGTGISLNGTTIANSDLGSSQNIFKTIALLGVDSFAAGSNADTLTFAAGTGVGIAIDPTTKKLTFSASSSDLNVSGFYRPSTGIVALQTITDSVGIGTTTPTATLHVVANSSNYGLILTATKGTGNYIAFRDASTATTDRYIQYLDTNHGLRFYSGGDRVTFDSAGNVGILIT